VWNWPPHGSVFYFKDDASKAMTLSGGTQWDLKQSDGQIVRVVTFDFAAPPAPHQGAHAAQVAGSVSFSSRDGKLRTKGACKIPLLHLLLLK
jgi:hypothetical protein